MPMPRMVWPRGRGPRSTGGSGRLAFQNCARHHRRPSRAFPSERYPRDWQRHRRTHPVLASMPMIACAALRNLMRARGRPRTLVSSNPSYATKSSAIRSSITRITVGMLMFSRSARLEGDATPSVRIKSITAARFSRRNRLDVVGWRFLHGSVENTGNERRHRPQPCQSPPLCEDAERQLSLGSESFRGRQFDDLGVPWRALKSSGVISLTRANT